MTFDIAGLAITVKGLEKLPSSWKNYEPFISPVDDGWVAPVCEVRCGRGLWNVLGEPTVESVLEDKTLRLWTLPDGCAVSLRFHGDGDTYHMRTNQDWSVVDTDCPVETRWGRMALADFLMVSFIYSAACHHVILVHGSSVVADGKAALFVGPSGVGKSTHSRLWTRYVKGSYLLNDDQPALRLLPDGKVWVYGTPWSGKTPCYKNRGAELKAIFRMMQAADNRAVPLDGVNAFCALLDVTSLMKADMRTFSLISDTVARVADKVGVYVLRNRPDKGAVETSHAIFMERQYK